MPHALTELKLAEVTRPAVLGSEPAHEIRADVCVVGAGIAGLSAAIESARLHRDVVLVDSLPLIGGQMVHSLAGAPPPTRRGVLVGGDVREKGSGQCGTVARCVTSMTA